MTEKSKSRQELLREINDLGDRLEKAQENLRSIGGGEVDGFVIDTSDTMQPKVLKGEYFPYRVIIESMGDGAVPVFGRPVELKLIPLIVIGGLALRTVLARQAEKIRHDGE